MNLSLSEYNADSYKSQSQKIRIVSESWFLDNGYCVNCLSSLKPFPNNQPVADFLCKECEQQYELKSKKGKFLNKIIGSEYYSMIRRINSNTNPNLFVLSYLEDSVVDIIAIPKFFFTESIIEKRKPLSEKALRAGWTGCNILFSEIPEIGKIFVIKDGEVRDQKTVNGEWDFCKQFDIKNLKNRGWTFEILKIIQKQNINFSIEDIYSYKSFLQQKYPDNNHIEDKIRQQLQILRDKKYIAFLEKGKYKRL